MPSSRPHPTLRDDFAERSRHEGGSGGKPLRLITVGRLCDFKAQHMLPRVHRMLIEGGIERTWDYVGDGELRNALEEAIDREGVRRYSRLHGALPFDTVKKMLYDSDIYVHNAVVAPDGGRESLGVSLMEASAAGLPVVSCKVGGIPVVVKHGETGLLVEEGDYEAMADSIAEIAADREMRFNLGSAGRKYVFENFDSAKLALRMDEVYGRVIRKDTSRGILSCRTSNSTV